MGFAIKKDIVTKLTEMSLPVGDRIVTMRLPLSKVNVSAIISVYVPTMTNLDEKTRPSTTSWQVCSLASLVQTLSIGNFKARIGRENDKWPLEMTETLAVLKRLGHLLTRQGKLAIFKSFITSNFNYIPLIWHFCSQSSTKKTWKNSGESTSLYLQLLFIHAPWPFKDR